MTSRLFCTNRTTSAKMPHLNRDSSYQRRGHLILWSAFNAPFLRPLDPRSPCSAKSTAVGKWRNSRGVAFRLNSIVFPRCSPALGLLSVISELTSTLDTRRGDITFVSMISEHCSSMFPSPESRTNGHLRLFQSHKDNLYNGTETRQVSDLSVPKIDGSIIIELNDFRAALP